MSFDGRKPYNRQAEFDEEVAGLLHQMTAACQRNQIQMIASFAVSADGDGVKLITTMVNSEVETENDINLFHKIHGFLNGQG